MREGELGERLWANLGAAAGNPGSAVEAVDDFDRADEVLVEVVHELAVTAVSRARNRDEIEHRQVLRVLAQAKSTRMAISDALNKELHDLADAGCPVIQIEDPQIHLLVARPVANKDITLDFMFGSDWPVCLLSAGYTDSLDLVRSAIAPDVVPVVLAETVIRAYGLELG